MDIPVLVLTGNVPALGVIRGLAGSRPPIALLYYDDDDTAQHSRHVAIAQKTVSPIQDEEGFVRAIQLLSRRLRGALLVPTSDETLAAVSRFRSELQHDFVLGCASHETVETCLDKLRTWRFCEANDLPAPRSAFVTGAGDAAGRAEVMGFPLLLKPAHSHLYSVAFGRKMTRADDADQLTAALAEAQEAGIPVMLQELIPGADDQVVNYNCYSWDGRVLAEFTSRQIRKAPPRLGSPRVVMSEWIPDAAVLGRRVAEAFGYCGFANMEMKWDPRVGCFKLIEVNARHNRSGLLAVRCGVNFPLIEYRHRTGRAVPLPGVQQDGIYWCDTIQDVAHSLRYVSQERIAPLDYLRPYLRPHCDPIFDRADTGPFRGRLGYVWRKVSSGGRRRGQGTSPAPC